MAINTASGSKYYVSTAAVLDTVDTIAEFEAQTWIEVGEVENLGDFGDESRDVPFAALSDERTRHAKGTRDAGTMQVVVGHSPLDTGQQKMIEAEATNNNYGFKVTIPDGPTDLYADSVFYYRGLVMSKRMSVGQADNVVRRTFNVGINSKIYEDPAHLITTT